MRARQSKAKVSIVAIIRPDPTCPRSAAANYRFGSKFCSARAFVTVCT